MVRRGYIACIVITTSAVFFRLNRTNSVNTAMMSTISTGIYDLLSFFLISSANSNNLTHNIPNSNNSENYKLWLAFKESIESFFSLN